MDAELCAAELMARNSHEHPDMPWEFHVDMARQIWDEIRHAEIHDRLMATELGCHWGDYPVGFGSFSSIYALDLLGRLALFNGTSEQRAMWRHSRPPQGADRPRPGDGRPRVRLPGGRRRCRTCTTARAGARTCSAATSRRFGRRCASSVAGSTAPGHPRPREASSSARGGPALPLLETAFWEVVNGLRSQRPSRPGALPAPRLPTPRTFCPPRSGCRERRGARNARISSRMQKPTTASDGHDRGPTQSGHVTPARR